MKSENQTFTLEFILLGVSDRPELERILFAVFFLVYLVTLCTNVLIIMVVLLNRHLQSPMYFFLCNLSFLDICYASTNIPKPLKNFLSERKTISFSGCAAQMYIALALGETECLLLMIMACDRYFAICRPLNYTTIMNRVVCIKIAICTWISGFLLAVIYVAFTLSLPFCGHNRINHFTCEVTAVLRLACTDIRLIEVVIFVVGVLILIIPLSFILYTYIHILVAILKIHSVNGRCKAFSTCTSHLTVVVIFYGSCIFVYMRPHSMVSPENDKIISLFYGAIIPMLNPLIYTLRNNEVKEALWKRRKRITLSSNK
uniref:Olfactory receptor n=1 Tax=Geotrypetes seraphini TaxID=260995 RepID=A0A6P8SHU7_GEOSA|nr:olfactory receptor 2K2-like [Geotrypetes seraphini]